MQLLGFVNGNCLLVFLGFDLLPTGIEPGSTKLRYKIDGSDSGAADTVVVNDSVRMIRLGKKPFLKERAWKFIFCFNSKGTQAIHEPSVTRLLHYLFIFGH